MIEDERRSDALTQALRAISNEDHDLRASSGVEARLRARVRAVAARRRRVNAAILGAAAALTVAIAVPAFRMLNPAPRPDSSSAPATATEVATDFLPLPFSTVPVTNAQLVRVQVPRSALASFGLAPIEALAAPATATVAADVVVGEDGLARAIRFVRASVAQP